MIEKPKTVGSEEYNAPELFINSSNHHDTALDSNHMYDGAKADVFSAGVTLFLMLTKCPPFRSANTKDPYFRRLSAADKKAFWKIFSTLELNENVRDLFEKMTEKDADSRYSISEVKAHQWLESSNKQYEEEGLKMEEMLKEIELRSLSL